MRSIHARIASDAHFKKLAEGSTYARIEYVNARGDVIYSTQIDKNAEGDISKINVAEQLLRSVAAESIGRDVARAVNTVRLSSIGKVLTADELRDGLLDLLVFAKVFLDNSEGRPHNLQAIRQMNGLTRQMQDVFPDILKEFQDAQKQLHGPKFKAYTPR